MTDSAGVPWAGRAFQPNPRAADDGSADARLVEAIRRFRAGELGLPEVVAALGAARLLAPLVAERGDEGIGPHGQTVDKTQELALVTISAPDGRTALPMFSCVDTMRTWNPQARPVPVDGARVGLAAASDGTDYVVLDPGSDTEFVVRRTAFESLATGARWTPSFEDAEVLDAFLTSSAGERAVLAIQLAPGDPQARLAGPELLVQLTLAPGLDRASLDALLSRLSDAWSRSAVIAQRVDSIAVRLEG